MDLHHVSRQQAAETLSADPDRGLSPAEAARRLDRHGKNQLRPARRQSWSVSGPTPGPTSSTPQVSSMPAASAMRAGTQPRTKKFCPLALEK